MSALGVDHAFDPCRDRRPPRGRHSSSVASVLQCRRPSVSVLRDFQSPRGSGAAQGRLRVVPGRLPAVGNAPRNAPPERCGRRCRLRLGGTPGSLRGAGFRQPTDAHPAAFAAVPPTLRLSGGPTGPPLFASAADPLDRRSSPQRRTHWTAALRLSGGPTGPPLFASAADPLDRRSSPLRTPVARACPERSRMGVPPVIRSEGPPTSPATASPPLPGTTCRAASSSIAGCSMA